MTDLTIPNIVQDWSAAAALMVAGAMFMRFHKELVQSFQTQIGSITERFTDVLDKVTEKLDGLRDEVHLLGAEVRRFADREGSGAGGKD